MTNNLPLLGIYSHWRRSHMLIPRGQSQNFNESTALVDEIYHRQEVQLRFLFLLNNKTTYAVIHRYQFKTNDAIIYLDYVCGSCNYFTQLCKLKIILKDNPKVTIASANGIFCLDQFNSCGYLSQSYIFCKKCLKRITKEKLLKYSIFNGISQHYY